MCLKLFLLTAVLLVAGFPLVSAVPLTLRPGSTIRAQIQGEGKAEVPQEWGDARIPAAVALEVAAATTNDLQANFFGFGKKKHPTPKPTLPPSYYDQHHTLIDRYTQPPLLVILSINSLVHSWFQGIERPRLSHWNCKHCKRSVSQHS